MYIKLKGVLMNKMIYAMFFLIVATTIHSSEVAVEDNKKNPRKDSPLTPRKHIRTKSSFFDLSREPAIVEDIAAQQPTISFHDFGEPDRKGLSEVIKLFSLCWKVQFQPPHIYVDPCTLDKEANEKDLGYNGTGNKRYDILVKNKKTLEDHASILFNALIFHLAKMKLRMELNEAKSQTGLEEVKKLIQDYPTLNPMRELYNLAKKKENIDLDKVSELMNAYIKPAEKALTHAGMKLDEK